MKESVTIREERHRATAIEYLRHVPLLPLHQVVIQEYKESKLGLHDWQTVHNDLRERHK